MTPTERAAWMLSVFLDAARAGRSDLDALPYLGEVEEVIEALKGLPDTPEVLAKVWFHDKPEEQDYDIFDAEPFSGSRPDCTTCVEALIVRGSHAAPTLPAAQEKEAE